MAAAPSINVVISMGGQGPQGPQDSVSAEAPGDSGRSEQEPQVRAGREQPPAAEDSGSLPGPDADHAELESLRIRTRVLESHMAAAEKEKRSLQKELSAAKGLNAWQVDRSLALEMENRQLQLALAARPALEDLTLYVSKGCHGSRFHRRNECNRCDRAMTLCQQCG